MLLVLGKIGLVFFVILTLAAYLVLAERRILAWIQDRKGPNRVGPLGLLQPLADVIKMLTKEDFRPAGADKWLFYLAPAMAAIPAIMTFAVVPFGAPVRLFGREVALQVADLNVGVLFFMALSSIAVYGVALGGWASNSKYALLGSIRGLGPADLLRAFHGALAGSHGDARPVVPAFGDRECPGGMPGSSSTSRWRS